MHMSPIAVLSVRALISFATKMVSAQVFVGVLSISLLGSKSSFPSFQFKYRNNIHPGYRWNRVTMLMRFNDVHTANGQVSLLYVAVSLIIITISRATSLSLDSYNDVSAINENNIIYRTKSDIDVGGLYFS